MVELVDDLLAGFALIELGVFDDRSVDFFEPELTSDLAPVIEEPAAKAQVFGVEIASAARRLGVEFGHGKSLTKWAGWAQVKCPSSRAETEPQPKERGPNLLHPVFDLGNPRGDWFAKEFIVIRLSLQTLVLVALCGLVLSACGESEAPTTSDASKPAAATESAPEPAAVAGSSTPDDLPVGLLMAVSKFERKDNKPVPMSELTVLIREGGEWKETHIDDPESNVFHKAMVYTPPGEAPGVLTLGGTAAVLKLWRKGENGLAPVETLWKEDFGGAHSRMREAEIADLYGDGKPAIAVATHDQGIFAVVRPKEGGGHTVEKLDQQENIWIHEIEIGDLDGDGVLEVYSTPSEPNKLDGNPQHGEVVRYVPAKGEGRVVVADLGGRHAKEILVEDVDGDGRDELYVSIEAAEGGKLEVRRYDAGTDPGAGHGIATVQDPMARFLTAGDVEGDGKKEMVLAGKDSGLWLLRPGSDPKTTWKKELIDGESKGFEHAALLTDLDGDGRDELYVASDDHKKINRYVWDGSAFEKETILTRSSPLPIFTWNITPVPVEVVR